MTSTLSAVTVRIPAPRSGVSPLPDPAPEAWRRIDAARAALRGLPPAA